MRVEITCTEHSTFFSALEVHKLEFDAASKSFSMRVVMGDDWIGQKIASPRDALPASVHIDPSKMTIEFERYQDAAAFSAWLIAADAKVAHGFRTMRG